MNSTGPGVLKVTGPHLRPPVDVYFLGVTESPPPITQIKRSLPVRKSTVNDRVEGGVVLSYTHNRVLTGEKRKKGEERVSTST